MRSPLILRSIIGRSFGWSFGRSFGRMIVLSIVLSSGLLGGCALLTRPTDSDAATPSSAGPPANDAESRFARRLRVTVDAPDGLSELLMRHLDISRLSSLPDDVSVSNAELVRLVAATPAQARELLQTEGYFDATVQVSPLPAASAGADANVGTDAEVKVTVQPGERSRVGRLDIELQGDLQDRAERGDAAARALAERLRNGWSMPSGAPFINARWNDAKGELLTQLRAAGYAAASWVGTAADVDTDKRQVRLFLVADSGPLFISGPLIIEGLEVHDEATVRHLAGFGSGTTLSESLLLDFQDRLRLAGLFDAVSVTFEPDTALAGSTPVRVRLKESPRQVWTLGAGFSANVGPRASVEHLHRRFMGYPLVARNKAEWAQLRQAWDGEISTHPLARQYRWLVGGAIERLESEDDIVLAQRIRFGRTQSTPRIDRLAFIEAERSSRRNLVPTRTTPEGTDLAVSLNFHGVWRRLDNPILPTRGWTLSMQGGAGRAHSTTGDSGYFTRLYGRVTGYWPLPGGWYSQGRIEAGRVFRPSTVQVPDSQQFRAGGDDSVRGYGYRSLGPMVDGAVDSGDVLATASFELARPIVRRLPDVWGAVFIDAGRAADSFSQFDPALGAGVGVRWRSPVGPLRLDWAYGQEERKGRIHFSVGIAF